MADIYFKVHFSASTIIFYQDLTSKYFSFKEKRFIKNSQISLLLITCSFSLKKHKIFSVARWKSNLSMNIIAHHILHWLIVDNERIFELFKFLTVSFTIVTERMSFDTPCSSSYTTPGGRVRNQGLWVQLFLFFDSWSLFTLNLSLRKKLSQESHVGVTKVDSVNFFSAVFSKKLQLRTEHA